MSMIGRFSKFSALKMDDVGRDLIHGQVIHTFVESDMFGYLDPRSFRVIPKDVLGCVGEKSKKDTPSGIWSKLGSTTFGRTDPHTSAKRS